jgi:preprotein translocase subunit SecE
VARQTREERRKRREAQGATVAPPRREQPARPVAEAAPAPAPAPARGGNIFVRFFRFVGESIAELRKVEWPRQSQVIQGTVVVLIACLVVGFYLWGADQVFKRLVEQVLLR